MNTVKGESTMAIMHSTAQIEKINGFAQLLQGGGIKNYEGVMTSK